MDDSLKPAMATHTNTCTHDFKANTHDLEGARQELQLADAATEFVVADSERVQAGEIGEQLQAIMLSGKTRLNFGHQSQTCGKSPSNWLFESSNSVKPFNDDGWNWPLASTSNFVKSQYRPKLNNCNFLSCRNRFSG